MSTELQRRRAREWYYAHHEQALVCMRDYRRSGRAREQRHRYYLKLKINVLSHYGGGFCQCVRCAFDDIRALSIDHINGGGTKHREIIGKSSSTIYVYLKKNNYPEGYQTLCMNCQFIKRHENKEHYNGGKVFE